MVSGLGRERGSASVLVAGACAVLLLATASIWAVAAALAARAQAVTAADLSALAAADRWTDPAGACAAARRIAALQGAELTRCSWSWSSAHPVVEVEAIAVRAGARLASGPAGAAVRGLVSATARATPFAGSAGQQGAEQGEGPGLVQGVVAVAALGRLHARRAAALALARRRSPRGWRASHSSARS